jgi:hypothetical protein
VLEESLSNTLREPALDLPSRQHRVDQPPVIVDRRIAFEPHRSGFGVPAKPILGHHTPHAIAPRHRGVLQIWPKPDFPRCRDPVIETDHSDETEETMPFTQELGRFVASLTFEPVPASGRDRSHSPGLTPAAGPASLYISGEIAVAPEVAINGTARHALDYDDVGCRGQVSTVPLPAILAKIETLNAGGLRDISRLYCGVRTWAELARRGTTFKLPHPPQGSRPTRRVIQEADIPARRSGCFVPNVVVVRWLLPNTQKQTFVSSL